ncbi:MAG: ROK family protein, partial [Candidatus Bipolaricaulota bacterium]
GCLEAIASGVGIARAAAGSLGENLSAQQVVDRARRGDPTAEAIVAEACGALGQGIAILWEILEPELIVLGGGLTGSWGFLGPLVLAAAERMSRSAPRIELTRLGDDVGLLGTAALPSYFPKEWLPG